MNQRRAAEDWVVGSAERSEGDEERWGGGERKGKGRGEGEREKLKTDMEMEERRGNRHWRKKEMKEERGIFWAFEFVVCGGGKPVGFFSSKLWRGFRYYSYSHIF